MLAPKRHFFSCLAAASVSLIASGCMPKMTIEQIKEMRPERPVELDRLNDFVGKWQFTGEAKMAGLDEVLKTSGTNETTWGGDGWWLVSRGEFTMGELGDMLGHEVWSWDAKAKKYRSTWVDNFGSTGSGTSTYNEKTKTWKMKTKSHGPMGTSVGTGTAKLIDKNTMEWTYTEWGGPFHLTKVMEMKGTSRRK